MKIPDSLYYVYALLVTAAIIAAFAAVDYGIFCLLKLI